MSFPDRAFNAATAVLNEIIAAYRTAEVDRPECKLPARRYVTLGQVAYDCDQCVVTVAGEFSHSGDLASTTSTTYAGHVGLRARGIRLGIVLLRKAPTIGENGLPTLTQETETAKLVLSDAERLARIVKYAAQDETLGINAVMIGDWLPVSAQGGLIGGSLDARIGLEAA